MFGEIVDNEMRLNELGGIVTQQLLWLQDNFAYVRVDEWVVMPNHVHVIIEINYNFNDDKTGYADNGKILGKDIHLVGNANKGLIFENIVTVGNGRDRSLPTTGVVKIKPLFDIIGAFKTTSSKLIHRIGHDEFKWQKSFHDRVIRDENELSRIREYIFCNPGKWAEDRNNPVNNDK